MKYVIMVLGREVLHHACEILPLGRISFLEAEGEQISYAVKVGMYNNNIYIGNMTTEEMIGFKTAYDIHASAIRGYEEVKPCEFMDYSSGVEIMNGARNIDKIINSYGLHNI